MKKIIVYVAVSLMMLGNQACKKNNAGTTESVNETITVNLGANEAYEYTLPASDNGQAYSISKQASGNASYSISNDANGSMFVYTPAQNFSGSDQVIVSNEPVQTQANNGQCNHGGCGHSKNHGNCSGNSKQGHSITFNISVAKVSE